VESRERYFELVKYELRKTFLSKLISPSPFANINKPLSLMNLHMTIIIKRLASTYCGDSVAASLCMDAMAELDGCGHSWL
jgi:hypothetical protein